MITIYIYKITNKINDKVYIGQSIRPVKQRFQRHINDAVNNVIDTHFARAIRKYGPENFVIEVIDTAESQDELNTKEQEWIRKCQSTNQKFGYNETDAIYKSGGNTYQSKTESELANITRKLSASKTGALNPNAVAVKCLNVMTGEELMFDTVAECQAYFEEGTHRFVTTRVSEQTRSLYRGEWAIAYLDSGYKYETVVHKAGIRLMVTDLESGETEIFESVRLFCREHSLNRGRLRSHIAAGEKEFIFDGRFKIIILN